MGGLTMELAGKINRAARHNEKVTVELLHKWATEASELMHENAVLADMANRKRIEKGEIEAMIIPATQAEIDRIWDDPQYRIAPWYCRGCKRIFTGWALQDHPFYISSEDSGVYYWCRGCAESYRSITPDTWRSLKP